MAHFVGVEILHTSGRAKRVSDSVAPLNALCSPLTTSTSMTKTKSDSTATITITIRTILASKNRARIAANLSNSHTSRAPIVVCVPASRIYSRASSAANTSARRLAYVHFPGTDESGAIVKFHFYAYLRRTIRGQRTLTTSPMETRTSWIRGRLC